MIAGASIASSSGAGESTAAAAFAVSGVVEHFGQLHLSGLHGGQRRNIFGL